MIVEKNFVILFEFRCWILFYNFCIMVIILDVFDWFYMFVDFVFFKLFRFGFNFFLVSIYSCLFYWLFGKFLWEVFFMYM